MATERCTCNLKQQPRRRPGKPAAPLRDRVNLAWLKPGAFRATMMNEPTATILGLVLAALSANATAQVVYGRQHDLLVAAIKAGHAEGVLEGPAAELFTKQFRSVGPLLVTADVIKSYPREGCKRLRVLYTKKHVLGPNGPQDVSLDTKMNYCLDGRPPVSLGAAQ
jgi:hypothetical protein